MEAASDLVDSVTKGKGGSNGGGGGISHSDAHGGGSEKTIGPENNSNDNSNGNESGVTSNGKSENLPASARRRLHRLGCCDLVNHGFPEFRNTRNMPSQDD